MLWLSDCGDSRENNISFLRLLGALFVLWGHSYALVNGPGGEKDPASEIIEGYTAFSMGLPGVGVSLFFLLSGFLITKSFVLRGNFLEFMEARILRIFPALIVVVVLSVFVLGPLFTSLSFQDYFSHKNTWSYLARNASLSSVQFSLPGVFSDNPRLGVNGSLWTLPVEFKMYLLVGVFGVLGVFSSKAIFNLFLVILLLTFSHSSGDFVLLEKESHARLAIFFLTGCFFYINSEDIVVSFKIALALTAFLIIFNGSNAFDLLFSIVFSYWVLVAAYHPIVRLPAIDKYGDFSYGIYIYAFPVQQSVIALCPKVSVFYLNLVSMPIVLVFAYLSWVLIESRFILMKGRFVSFSFFRLK